MSEMGQPPSQELLAHLRPHIYRMQELFRLPGEELPPRIYPTQVDDKITDEAHLYFFKQKDADIETSFETILYPLK